MSCTQEVQDIIILFQDGNRDRKMYFDNALRRLVKKVHVDGCAITQGKRCDFMLIDHNVVEYYIELKGTDIGHACEQIIETIKKLSADSKNAVKCSFVICTACPLTTTTIQLLKVKFKRLYNSSLLIKSNKHTYILN